MNNKISSGQVLSIGVGLIVALFPGLVNFLILSSSKNASIISIIIASIIGFIPLFMIITISKRIKNLSLKEYIKNNYPILGLILNIILITVALFILFLNSWLIIDFIISQFLTRTSYYFIAIIFFIIIAWTINKGIETTSRAIFIMFLITVTIMILLWTSLIPYIKLDNLKPYIDVSSTSIIKSSIIYICTTTLPIIFLLDLKHITNDKKNFERKIIVSYIISCIITTVFIFLIISVYTIDIATILTYPVYSLFKKVQIFGFIERIENFAGIQILVAFYIQTTFLIYYLKENISKTLKMNSKVKKQILTYIISLIIPLISILIFKKYNIINIINISPYIIGTLIIVILLLFIKPNKKST